MDQNFEGQSYPAASAPAALYNEVDLAMRGAGSTRQGLKESNAPGLEPMFITGEGEPRDKPVVVLDPGHSGQDITRRDQTGLNDHDYPNDPEIHEAWDVAQEVGRRLEAAGYEVVMTKDSALDSVSLRDRAEIAKAANADLAVSIHTDHTKEFDSFGQIYAQEVGLWRGGTEHNPTVQFTNAAVANASQNAASHFEQAREQAEGHDVEVTRVNFANRPGIDPGNISQVQLYAGEGPNAVPWVYNEVGGQGFENPGNQEAYIDGLTNAIKASVPIA